MADFEALAERYVKVRDAKSALTKDYKEKCDRLDTVLEALEGVMMTEMKAIGVESVKTKQGTCFQTTKTQARVGDWAAIMDFIRVNEAWAFLERRIAKRAVEEHLEATGQIPPGVDWVVERVVQVRR